MDAAPVEPVIDIQPIAGAHMSVRSDGYGVGLLWCSHLRVGRREITHWFDSPTRKLREINESVVTQKVVLLGRECFEVQIRECRPIDQEWSASRSEYLPPQQNLWAISGSGNAPS